jgi:transposase
MSGSSGNGSVHPGREIGALECSGGERSEPKRNARAPMRQTDEGDGRPDPEVFERAKRRRFSAEYKARIVQEATRCTEWGQIGALLRREGLYWSEFSRWRRKYSEGAESALREEKRGRKRRSNPLEGELAKLRKENERLKRRLHQAETIIDVQKKISEMLGIPLQSTENEEDE